MIVSCNLGVGANLGNVTVPVMSSGTKSETKCHGKRFRLAAKNNLKNFLFFPFFTRNTDEQMAIEYIRQNQEDKYYSNVDVIKFGSGSFTALLFGWSHVWIKLEGNQCDFPGGR